MTRRVPSSPWSLVAVFRAKMVQDGAIESIGQYMATRLKVSINIMRKRDWFWTGIESGRRCGSSWVGAARGWRMSGGPGQGSRSKGRIACPGRGPQVSASTPLSLSLCRPSRDVLLGEAVRDGHSYTPCWWRERERGRARGWLLRAAYSVRVQGVLFLLGPKHRPQQPPRPVGSMYTTVCHGTMLATSRASSSGGGGGGGQQGLRRWVCCPGSQSDGGND